MKENDKETIDFIQTELLEVYEVESNIIGKLGEIKKDSYNKYFVFYSMTNYYKAFHLYCIMNKLNKLNDYHPKTYKE